MAEDTIEYCPICREQHSAERELSFDGAGVNSCGVYRTRIATLPECYRHLGSLFSASPQLLAELDKITDLPADDEGNRIIPAGFLDAARKAIRKAEMVPEANSGLPEVLGGLIKWIEAIREKDETLVIECAPEGVSLMKARLARDEACNA